MKRTTKLLLMLVVLVVSAGLTSCELFGIADNPVSPRLKVKSASLTLKVGDTKKCPITASTRAKLLYGSSDETIATVDANGLVTGVKEGDAVITVVATNQEGSDLFLEESAIVTVKVVNEAVALLEDAKEENAGVSITYTLNGTEKTALFKRVGDDYVLQSSVDGSGIVPYLTPIASDEQEGEGESDDEDEFENLDSDVEEDWNYDDDDDDDDDDADDDDDDGDDDDDDDDADAGARAWTRADEAADDDEVGKDLLFGLTIKATDVDILQTQFNTATGTYTEVQADDSDADGNTAAFVGLKVNGKQVAINPQPSLTRASSKEVMKIKSIKLKPKKKELEADCSFLLQATVSPKNATDKSLKWQTSNKNIATVSSKFTNKEKKAYNIESNKKKGIRFCKVTGEGEGYVTIKCRAKKGGKKKTCKVVVVEKVHVTGVSLDHGTLSLETGATATLTATIAPSGASEQDLTWTSSNEEVATVTAGTDGKATVTAVKAGLAVIIVTTVDRGKTSKCTIMVTDPKPDPEPEPEPEPDKPVIDATDDFEDGGDPLK